MNEWKVYMLDRKVKEKDRRAWDRPADNRVRGEYPKMLLHGQPDTTLKDAQGKGFEFRLVE